jgi:hypothetical protein
MLKDAPIYSQVRRFCPDRRPTGSYPETGLEEIKRDLLEADFWTSSRLAAENHRSSQFWHSDTFRIARQNEAAGAADAAAWVMSAVLIFGSDNLCVTRRCPCDPSTQNGAGRTPASSLL